MPSLPLQLPVTPPAPPADNAIRELVRTFGLVEKVMHPYFARFGISGSQWGVLRNLYRAEEEGLTGLRLTDLGERLLIRPASVTGVVDRLERAELVIRSDSPTDLRVKQVRLTPAGRQLVERVLASHSAQMDIVLGGLSETERSDLQRLLARLGQHLGAMLARGETANFG
jgi:MarR family 2-MHQ and catechol resistance regulon transcriptional repressor